MWSDREGKWQVLSTNLKKAEIRKIISPGCMINGRCRVISTKYCHVLGYRLLIRFIGLFIICSYRYLCHTNIHTFTAHAVSSAFWVFTICSVNLYQALLGYSRWLTSDSLRQWCSLHSLGSDDIEDVTLTSNSLLFWCPNSSLQPSCHSMNEVIEIRKQ